MTCLKAAVRLEWARALLEAIIGGKVQTVNEFTAEASKNVTVRVVYTLQTVPVPPLWEVKAFEDSRAPK